MEKFTIKQFEAKYPNDDACLDEIFRQRYGELTECPSCNKGTKFHRVKGRKCYKCQYCAFELHPLADTIFHKSSTSLKDWFRAIYLFANSKNGVSAKELQRHLGVTYKTAWRMANRIRLLFQNQDVDGEMMKTLWKPIKLMWAVDAGESADGARQAKPQ
jgi:transposase